MRYQGDPSPLIFGIFDAPIANCKKNHYKAYFGKTCNKE
jgi:hypothetical protein